MQKDISTINQNITQISSINSPQFIRVRADSCEFVQEYEFRSYRDHNLRAIFGPPPVSIKPKDLFLVPIYPATAAAAWQRKYKENNCSPETSTFLLFIIHRDHPPKARKARQNQVLTVSLVGGFFGKYFSMSSHAIWRIVKRVDVFGN